MDGWKDGSTSVADEEVDGCAGLIVGCGGVGVERVEGASALLALAGHALALVCGACARIPAHHAYPVCVELCY